MENYYQAIEGMYEYRKSIIVLGLTGRTGSGCSKVGEILRKDSFTELDLKRPKTYDYADAEERKYEIIYNFMKEGDNWSKFHIIEGSAIIFSFVHELGYDALINYLDENDRSGFCKLDNLDEIKKELEKIKEIFTSDNELLKSDDTNDEHINNQLYVFYVKKLPEYKKMLQGIFSKHVCYPSNNHDGKAQLYTYLMQTWGNNIRASGSPYQRHFTQKNYYDIAKRIDQVIYIIKEHEKENVRICIDALRNPYEVIYFRDSYRNFYAVSISTEEKYRKNRLSFLSKKEQDALESTECPTQFKETEEQFYHQNVQGCVQISDIHIYNPDVENKKFYFLTQQILKYIALIIHPGLITPTHVERCMQLAYNAKFNSGCLSRQVGAVITGDDFSVRAVGWNDVPKGQIPCVLRCVDGYCCNKDAESFSEFELSDSDFDEGMKKIREELNGKELGGRTFSYCFKDVYNGYKGTTNQVLTRALHAEENAFLQISKYGGVGIRGGFLFTTSSPCELCAKKAYQLGITNIYYIEPYPGISKRHILTFGKHGNPKMNLFYGAIGNAYIALYEPRMALKDELELVTGVKVKQVVKKDNGIQGVVPIVSDIKYNKMELSLEYESNEEITAYRNIDIEVTGEPINHIEKEIIWTGSEYKGSTLIDNSQGYTLEDSERKNSPFRYKLLFNKSIMKGEKASYKIQTVVTDKENTMEPFFSHTVKNPTENLLLHIKFPKDMIKEPKVQAYADAGREIKIGDSSQPEKECIDGYDIFKYSIPKPKLLYTYSIEWKFQNTNTIENQTE